jgi:hypothetical protein
LVAPLKETYSSKTYSAVIKNGVISLSLQFRSLKLLYFSEFCDSAEFYFKISSFIKNLLIASVIESFILFDWFEFDYFDMLSAVDFYWIFFLLITSANLNGVVNLFFGLAEEWKSNFLILPILLSYDFSKDPSVLTFFDLYVFILSVNN